MNNIERARSALNYLDSSCPRDEWIRIGMAAKAAKLTFEDFHVWSKNTINYKGEKDCRNIWNSFNELGGITGATLFHIAHEKGWQDPTKIHASSTNSNYSHNYHQKEKESHNETPNMYALEIWKRCLPAEATHEYILQKQGKPDGLRYYPSSEPPLIINGIDVTGYLAVPCLSGEKIQTLQFIPPNGGKKLNLNRGAKFNDGYFTVGAITDLIYIVEGLGQAWAVNKTGGVAVVCFGAGRMPSVAKCLRKNYPHARLVITPDRGKEKQASDIAFSINGQWIELPSDKPNNYDVNDYAKDHGYEALANLLAEAKLPELSYKLLSIDDLYNAPPMRWIVKGIIPKEGLAALYGPSGSGKSFLLLDLALSIATGESFWFSRRITPVPVTYICLEGESGFGKRVKAWFTYTTKPLPSTIHFVTQPFNLLTDDVSELAKAIIFTGYTDGLIILDTLNRAIPGADENSSVDMGRIILACSNLQKLTGGVILIAHHMGKDETKKMRGHTSLPAALDGAIEAVRTGIGRQWAVAKSKDDKDGDIYPFKLEVVNLGVDEDGDAITSCVVEIDNTNAADELRRVIPPKAGNQKLVWDSVKRLLASSKEHGKGRAPTDRPCLRLDDAVSQLHGCLTCESKRQTERIRSAITGLISRGLLVLQEGWIWTA